MTYSRPEIAVLGEATRIIELVNPKRGSQKDFSQIPNTAPAYDLDE
jgi:hypothetical protein